MESLVFTHIEKLAKRSTCIDVRTLCEFVTSCTPFNQWNWYIHRYWLYYQIRYFKRCNFFDRQCSLHQHINTYGDVMITLYRVSDKARMAIMWKECMVIFSRGEKDTEHVVEMEFEKKPYDRVISLRYNDLWFGSDRLLPSFHTTTSFGKPENNFSLTSPFKFEIMCHESSLDNNVCKYPPLFQSVYSEKNCCMHRFHRKY